MEKDNNSEEKKAKRLRGEEKYFSISMEQHRSLVLINTISLGFVLSTEWLYKFKLLSVLFVVCPFITALLFALLNFYVSKKYVLELYLGDGVSKSVKFKDGFLSKGSTILFFIGLISAVILSILLI